MSNIRLVVALPFVLVALVLSLGCNPTQLQVQAAAADALGRAVNASTPVLVGLYEADCGKAADQGGKPAAEACETRWKPAWDAIQVLAAAQDAWAVAIVAGQEGNWNKLILAGCAVVNVLRVLAPTVTIPILSASCPVPGVKP